MAPAGVGLEDAQPVPSFSNMLSNFEMPSPTLSSLLSPPAGESLPAHAAEGAQSQPRRSEVS